MAGGLNFLKIWVPYELDLYFLNLDLVFIVKCYITIPISFVFHVTQSWL